MSARRRSLLAAVLAVAGAAVIPAAVIAAPPDTPAALQPVLQDVLRGDLVVAGNSNLLSAGGWRSLVDASADVDGDSSLLCLSRRSTAVTCADNSSSAALDVPSGARVVAARLYVATSVSPSVAPLRVRLDGPAPGYDYTQLGLPDTDVPKIAELQGTGRAGKLMRQATWDVTAYVQAAGPGDYTVADIAVERAAAYMPYATWAIVAAYELAPGADLAAMPEDQRARFALRAISWFDGLALSADDVTVPVTGGSQPAAERPFGTTFHFVAHPGPAAPANLLFDGRPVGNSASPGDGPAPASATIGTDAACNETTGILNDSICLLGSPVTTKAPGAIEFTAVHDGRTSTSGSGVDLDVVRIPDRYLRSAGSAATLSLHTFGDDPVAVGVLATSINQSAADDHEVTE